MDHAGFLDKKGSMRWQARWFMLDGSSLSYSDKPAAAKKDAKELHLVGCTLDLKKGSKEFSIAGARAGSDLKLRAKSSEDASAWVAALTAACSASPKRTSVEATPRNSGPAMSQALEEVRSKHNVLIVSLRHWRSP